MKKKLLILLCSLLLSISLVGCGSESGESESEYTTKESAADMLNDKFHIFVTGNRTRIYVDKETKVQYLFVERGYGAGLTVLVDSEGKPILYEGDLEVE